MDFPVHSDLQDHNVSKGSSTISSNDYSELLKLRNEVVVFPMNDVSFRNYRERIMGSQLDFYNKVETSFDNTRMFTITIMEPQGLKNILDEVESTIKIDCEIF